ncbi:uncharacterized protein LOC125158312 [Prionailurus viverrinus]|uniref:uncharacterized protein LOC125158312 n=1 Tax=Prionailurus viverrinus TaxID=61388 RepID=UPI001FF2F812|nr:uncharacterized protein LOC125158312 [Prionailurus viverrinus]
MQQPVSCVSERNHKETAGATVPQSSPSCLVGVPETSALEPPWRAHPPGPQRWHQNWHRPVPRRNSFPGPGGPGSLRPHHYCDSVVPGEGPEAQRGSQSCPRSPHSSGGQKFKVRVSAGLVPSEGCEGFTEVDCEPQRHSRCLWFELARGLAGSQEAQVSWMSSGQALGPGQPSLPGNTWPGPGKNPPASLPGTWAIHLRAQARPPVRPAPCAAQTPFLSLMGKCRAFLHPAHHHTDFAGDKRGLCGTEVSRDLSVPIGCW